MIDNNRFYTIARSEAEIVQSKDGKHFIKRYDWRSARTAHRGKVFFIDRSVSEKDFYTILPEAQFGDMIIEEVPSEFLNMKDNIDRYETSINYSIEGQFFTSEIAFRSHKRLFSWDRFIYRLPHGTWLPAYESPMMREFLEQYYPHTIGDAGQGGGLIFRCQREGDGYRCTEAAPFDIGCMSWHDAERVCREYSRNGTSGWRLPSIHELKDFALVLRTFIRNSEDTTKMYKTTETVLNWSREMGNHGDACAIVTQENEDYYEPPYTYPMGGSCGGYWKSKKGPWRNNEQWLPLSHYISVRPVREFFVKKAVVK